MLLRPLRRAPMMLGGVGFQAGLDKARRERMPAPDVVSQLRHLKALRDGGVLTPDEFAAAKRKVLG